MKGSTSFSTGCTANPQNARPQTHNSLGLYNRMAKDKVTLSFVGLLYEPFHVIPRRLVPAMVRGFEHLAAGGFTASGLAACHCGIPPILQAIPAAGDSCPKLIQRQPAVQGRAAHIERPADVHHQHLLVGVERFRRLNPWIIRQDRLPTSQPTTRTGCRQPSPGTFLNQPPLKLRQAGEHIEDQFATGRRRVNGPVADRLEPYPTLTEFLDQIDQVPNRPAQAIQTPYQQRIAVFKLGEAFVQAGPG